MRLGASERYGALMSMRNAACPIYYTKVYRILDSSHYLKSRSFQERMEKHSSSEYTLRKQDFRAATARVSPRNDILPLSYVAESSRKASGNDPLTAVLPCKKVTLRVKDWSSVSQRGFFLPLTTTPCLPRTSAR